MKLLLLSLVSAMSFALNNSRTIFEASSQTQTNRPVTLHLVFAKGEIPGYPKPRGLSIWQADVKSRWPDGSVMFAYVSFRQNLSANGSATVDFVNSGGPCHLGDVATCEAAALDEAGLLNYDTGGGAGSWGCKVEGTVNAITYSASARTIIDAAQFEYWLRGPVVTEVIARDNSPALARNFGWQWNGSAWQAPGGDQYKSLFPVFDMRFYPDPDGGGALTAWAGVECDAQLWNSSTTRLQLIPLATLRVLTGGSETTVAYSSSNVSFHARRRFHKLVWSGTPPGEIVVDYNLDYMIHTRLVPAYDNSLPITSTLADSDLATYDSRLGSDEAQFCTTNNTYCTMLVKMVGSSGGRGEIAILAQWAVKYLYAMGRPMLFTAAKRKEIWDKLIIGVADGGGSMPIHYMETDASYSATPFTSGHAAAAFGRTVSIDARPTVVLGGSAEPGSMAVCAASPCDGRATASSTPYKGGWVADGLTNFSSHQPSLQIVAALLTGRWYYITGQQMFASYGIATNTSGTGDLSRREAKGVMVACDNFRAHAWVLRDFYWAYLLSPDGSPEKLHFAGKIKNNIAIVEGKLNVIAGAHTPANTACPGFDQSNPAENLWCVGRFGTAWTRNGRTYTGSNPLCHWCFQGINTSPTDGWVNNGIHNTSFWYYYVAVVHGWISQTGALIDDDGLQAGHHTAAYMAGRWAGQALDPGYDQGQLSMIDAGAGVADVGNHLCETWSCVTPVVAATDGLPLDANISASDLTVILNSPDVIGSLADNGGGSALYSWLRIDSEIMRPTNIQRNSPAGKTTITLSSAAGQGRGQQGTTAASHTAGATAYITRGWGSLMTAQLYGGYGVLARAAMATLSLVPQTGAYSPQRAYEALQGAVPNQYLYYTDPMWAFVRPERITNVRRIGDTLRFVAPTGGACSWANNPTSSLDTGDTVMQPGSRDKSIDVSGLTGVVRITCGTARQNVGL